MPSIKNQPWNMKGASAEAKALFEAYEALLKKQPPQKDDVQQLEALKNAFRDKAGIDDNHKHLKKEYEEMRVEVLKNYQKHVQRQHDEQQKIIHAITNMASKAEQNRKRIEDSIKHKAGRIELKQKALEEKQGIAARPVGESTEPNTSQDMGGSPPPPPPPPPEMGANPPPPPPPPVAPPPPTTNIGAKIKPPTKGKQPAPAQVGGRMEMDPNAFAAQKDQLKKQEQTDVPVVQKKAERKKIGEDDWGEPIYEGGPDEEVEEDVSMPKINVAEMLIKQLQQGAENQGMANKSPVGEPSPLDAISKQIEDLEKAIAEGDKLIAQNQILIMVYGDNPSDQGKLILENAKQLMLKQDDVIAAQDKRLKELNAPKEGSDVTASDKPEVASEPKEKRPPPANAALLAQIQKGKKLKKAEQTQKDTRTPSPQEGTLVGMLAGALGKRRVELKEDEVEGEEEFDEDFETPSTATTHPKKDDSDEKRNKAALVYLGQMSAPDLSQEALKVKDWMAQAKKMDELMQQIRQSDIQAKKSTEPPAPPPASKRVSLSPEQTKQLEKDQEAKEAKQRESIARKQKEEDKKKLDAERKRVEEEQKRLSVERKRLESESKKEEKKRASMDKRALAEAHKKEKKEKKEAKKRAEKEQKQAKHASMMLSKKGTDAQRHSLSNTTRANDGPLTQFASSLKDAKDKKPAVEPPVPPVVTSTPSPQSTVKQPSRPGSMRSDMPPTAPPPPSMRDDDTAPLPPRRSIGSDTPPPPPPRESDTARRQSVQFSEPPAPKQAVKADWKQNAIDMTAHIRQLIDQLPTAYKSHRDTKKGVKGFRSKEKLISSIQGELRSYVRAIEGAKSQEEVNHNIKELQNYLTKTSEKRVKGTHFGASSIASALDEANQSISKKSGIPIEERKAKKKKS